MSVLLILLIVCDVRYSADLHWKRSEYPTLVSDLEGLGISVHPGVVLHIACPDTGPRLTLLVSRRGMLYILGRRWVLVTPRVFRLEFSHSGDNERPAKSWPEG